MTLAKRLQPYLAATLTSARTRALLRRLQEAKRVLGAQPHVLTAWLAADDPYSYLLLQLLPRVCAHFDVTLRLEWLAGSEAATVPEPEKLAAYARMDAQRLARFHELDFPADPAPPAPDVVAGITGQLLAAATLPVAEQLTLARQLLATLWHGQHGKLATLAARFPALPDTRAAAALAASRARLTAAGHYLPGMLHYAGEWYWGVDRLPHLAGRLQALGVARVAHGFVLNESAPQMDADFLVNDYRQLARLRALNLRLDFYFSFRSPYSYLALARVFALADHYGLDLRIRPVLPMVMRGLPVPREKRLYILLDAAREAGRLGTPFGRVCDPVGAGVERCMALFTVARAAGREREFLLAVARGIWAEGADVSRDDVLGRYCATAGLPLTATKLADALADEGWRAMAEGNRQALGDLGLWGVPVLHLQLPDGDCRCWGQDRLWALEAALADVAGSAPALTPA